MKKNGIKKYSFIIIVLIVGVLLGIRVSNLSESYSLPTNWYTDYTYVLNDTENTITLTKYNGEDTIIEVEPQVTINDNVYQVIIDGEVYKDKTNLTKVTFNNGVIAGTSLQNTFNNCKELKEINFNNFDTSHVTTMHFMFSSCSSLKSLDLSGFDTSNVTDMRGMFSNCSSLKSLDLSSFDTSNVTDMFNMLHSLNINEIKIGNKMNFYANDYSIKGSVFERGTWKRLEDNKLYSAVDVAIDSSTKDVSGTYVKMSDIIEEMAVDFLTTFRINMKNSYTDGEYTFTTTNPSKFEIINNSLVVKDLNRTETDDYVVPGSATFVYKNIVNDAADNKYNLRVTYDNVHIYDLNTVEGYSNFIAKIASINSKGLQSYLYSDRSLQTTIGSFSIKQDVKFEIINDNGEVQNGSFVFSAYDLDVASSRDKNNSETPGYGNYSEGINLLEGYDDSNLIMYSNTYLRRNNNRIYGIHNDEGSELSEFIIKGDASGFKFAWTGEGCLTGIMSFYQPMNVAFLKEDNKGNVLSGVTLGLYKNNELYDETWISSSEPHKLFLNPGKYTLKEDNVPTGYQKGSDVVFYVDYDGTLKVDGLTVPKIVMVNVPKKYPYIINYIDKSDDVIMESTNLEAEYNSIIYGNDYQKDFEGYLFDSIDKDSITILENDNIINIYYEKQKIIIEDVPMTSMNTFLPIIAGILLIFGIGLLEFSKRKNK